MSGSTLTPEQQDALANKAQRDATTGEWYVNTIGGERMNVSDVKESDLSSILSNDNDEKAIQYAQNTMSFVEKIEATTKQIDAKLGALSFSNFGETVDKSNKNTLDYYTKNIDSVLSAIHIDRKESIKAQEEQLKRLETIGKDIVKALSVIKNPYEDMDMDKEKQKIDIQEAQNKYRRNIKGRMDTWDEKWDKTVAVNAMERGGDSGWNWWKNRASAIWEGFTNSNEELDERARATGYIDNKGMPVIINEETLKPIHDGMAFISQSNIRDGIINGNGTSMAVPASKVAPIHDGMASLVKSDPKDIAIFAKPSGPFDTLFNGIFDKINDMYGMFADGMEHSNKLSSPYLLPIPTVHDNVIPLPSDTSRNNMVKSPYPSNSQNSQWGNIGKGQFDVNIRGEINLKANGQSFNILRQLQEDPSLVRAITQMISESIASQKHGGRAPYGGYRW